MRSLSVAASGLLAQQLNVDIVSNNIANLSTTAFKQQRASFQDLIYEDLRRVGTSSSATDTIIPNGLQVGLGVKTGAASRVTEQGALNGTTNPFDFAIQGEGYFVVTLPDGTQAYTRDGTFGRDGDGDLVTQDGYEVSPTITIPTGAIDITVNAEGQVLVTTDVDQPPTEVGQIDLAVFLNPAGLSAQGNNLFVETEASGTPTLGFAGDEGFGSIQQGFLEASNVDAVLEVTGLITAQRSYELNSRVITTTDEMLQTLNQA